MIPKSNEEWTECIIQVLHDTDCSVDTTQDAVELFQKKKGVELHRILSDYRMSLLDELHKDQRKIDCLDYLMNGLEKEGITKNVD